jgi:hypothetical protein
MKDKLSSPFTPPHKFPDRDGDRRDTHDHNPSTNLNVARDMGKADPENDFVEGMPGGKGHVGRVADIAPDILSTAMGGQRRSATGEYESTPSIHDKKCR